MCGLTGFLGASPQESRRSPRLLDAMADAIHHRGPDSGGQWLNDEDGIGLAHRRLAVVELTSAGDQPMHSHSGRFVIVYNGELYNHLSLREELDDQRRGINWRGHSDTETLLAGFDAWGVRKTLERAAGMFAFAAWDRQEKELILARDRLGEKPLYYGWQGANGDSSFIFGSELKGLARHPSFAAEVDRDALAAFMQHGYIPAPKSIYRGIAKLLPGTFLIVSRRAADPRIESYWSAADAILDGVANPFVGPASEAIDGLETLLKDAVSKQLMSDVPLGAFLSGGIDSSTIVALMQSQSSQPAKTFTIGFREPGYNEAEQAKAVAAHLGTDHIELYVSPDDALQVIPKLPQIYDEPFADSSQIPTFMISELARGHVTVALSGDGGDELFGGYDRYRIAERMWGKVGLLPASLRKAAGAAIQLVPKRVLNPVGRLAGISGTYSTPGDTIHKAARLLSSPSAAELGLATAERWDGAGLVLGASPDAGRLGCRLDPGRTALDMMMAVDLQTYLPDDILAKVDRAAMAVSLETRVPFLDHRVVEYAWRLPPSMKVRDGQSKWVLRELLSRYLPRDLIDRPKRGFSVPVRSWLRGPLREWAEELLDEKRLESEGYLRPKPIRRAWKAHLGGQSNLQAQLWTVLMFQAWLRGRR